MKIYHVSNARLPTEKAHGLAIMKTCEALARAGNEVELIVPARRNELTEDPFLYYGVQPNFRLHVLPTLDIKFGRIGFLVQELTFAVSVVSFLMGKSGVLYSRDEVVLWPILWFRQMPVVWESHVGAWNMAARSVARICENLVVISYGLKDFYCEKGISADKITVIPSAVDLEQFAKPETKGAARARLGLPEHARIAMYIGRLDGWKGSDALLAAAAALAPDILVVVIGGEQKQIDKLKAQYPGVIFLGFRPYSELSDNQAAADVLVVPNTGKDTISARFTSPLKLIAHLAAERPIVASDLPSIREIVGDAAAYLVPPDDSAALAAGILRVFGDSELALRFARRAKEKAGAYTWDARAKAITSMLESVFRK